MSHQTAMLATFLPSFPWASPEREPWMDEALCGQVVDPEMFFPEKGGTTRPAKSVCASCDVREQCLAYAMAHDVRFGVWGGLSEQERRALRKALS